MLRAMLLIYGASGYTGTLVAQRAVELGLRPVLAGRDAEKLRRVAEPLGLPVRIVALGDRAGWATALTGVACVLNCAGPFRRTAEPVFEACLAAHAHYLDVTGETAVFEALARRSDEAKQAQIMALPGVGFDVVPSDCLARHLAERLPEATRLTLAIRTRGGISHGTATTMIEELGSSALVREGSRLTPIRLGSRQRQVDFGRGLEPTVAIAWGDVASAFYSTGIPNIEVYWAVSRPVAGGLAALGGLVTWAASPRVRRFLQRRVDARAAGPTEDERAGGKCVLWGEASSPDGRSVSARLFTPEGYDVTVSAALHIVRRVLTGELKVGFQTPATWGGPDFVLELPGVRREALV